MPMELKPLIRTLGLSRAAAGHAFSHEGTIGDDTVVATVSGMGPRLATEATERLLDAVDVDRVVMIGIAGGVDPALPIGHVLTPAVVIDGDTGAEYHPSFVADVTP